MERREAAQHPFEVFCQHCQCSFAAGTRSCIHCGRRIGRGSTLHPGTQTGIETVPGIERAGDEALEEVSPLRRLGGISLWVLIALGAAITRMCEGA